MGPRGAGPEPLEGAEVVDLAYGRCGAGRKSDFAGDDAVEKVAVGGGVARCAAGVRPDRLWKSPSCADAARSAAGEGRGEGPPSPRKRAERIAQAIRAAILWGSAPQPPGRWGSPSLRGRIPMRGALSTGCWGGRLAAGEVLPSGGAGGSGAGEGGVPPGAGPPRRAPDPLLNPLPGADAPPSDGIRAPWLRKPPAPALLRAAPARTAPEIPSGAPWAPFTPLPASDPLDGLLLRPSPPQLADRGPSDN